MPKFALAVVVAASAIGLLTAMDRPPVEKLVEGQQQCGNGTAVCIGDNKHAVRLQGPVLLDKPILPTSAQTVVLIDGGVGINGTLTVGGSQTMSGTVKVGVVDAGILCAQSSGCITRTLPWTSTIDFVTATTTCTDSNAITVTGAQVNDPCFVGPPASGGSTNASYTCYVSSAGNVKARHCAAGTADDPASATFSGFVLSYQ